MTLSLRGVTKTIPLGDGRHVDLIRDLDFDLAPGDSVSVVGRSGSGKSSLLNILGLLDRPTSGRVELDGQSLLGLPDRKLSTIRGRHISFIFQQFHLLPRRTALENVWTPLAHIRDRALWRQRRELAAEALARVGLTGKEDAVPETLSGGEQQRVAIARALVHRPRYVLADEPTGALDGETARSVMDLLLDVTRSQRTGLVLVTHDAQHATATERQLRLTEGTLAPLVPEGRMR
ncbi:MULTISPECIES: ABC transporter ATP-binding protein [unclassified Streptomyces]|uniref:ABC transporter ATP-binding protein n=1 Tax=unclassified Streptomyces TaxID=2593676 RepID=UPI0023659277|nr:MULTISPECIES: ABC transporter ATP-binding protein [unclassified Streptomyces]MDF3142543.1 ABC transporter ATP-binding protein [Streptomyces sp. T21Q-yed]WDF38289.1 ABC transporter ATP-binding protein [Streptomyces sp. T12]